MTLAVLPQDYSRNPPPPVAGGNPDHPSFDLILPWVVSYSRIFYMLQLARNYVDTVPGRLQNSRLPIPLFAIHFIFWILCSAVVYIAIALTPVSIVVDITEGFLEARRLRREGYPPGFIRTYLYTKCVQQSLQYLAFAIPALLVSLAGASLLFLRVAPSVPPPPLSFTTFILCQLASGLLSWPYARQATQKASDYFRFPKYCQEPSPAPKEWRAFLEKELKTLPKEPSDLPDKHTKELSRIRKCIADRRPPWEVLGIDSPPKETPAPLVPNPSALEGRLKRVRALVHPDKFPKNQNLKDLGERCTVVAERAYHTILYGTVWPESAVHTAR